MSSIHQRVEAGLSRDSVSPSLEGSMRNAETSTCLEQRAGDHAFPPLKSP